MDFFDLKQWLKSHGLTFKLEGWSCCIPDTILVYQEKQLVYEGDYHHEVDYTQAVEAIKARLGLAE